MLENDEKEEGKGKKEKQEKEDQRREKKSCKRYDVFHCFNFLIIFKTRFYMRIF